MGGPESKIGKGIHSEDMYIKDAHAYKRLRKRIFT
jgi:hypothetical protein